MYILYYIEGRRPPIAFKHHTASPDLYSGPTFQDTFRIQGMLVLFLFLDTFCIQGIWLFFLFQDTFHIQGILNELVTHVTLHNLCSVITNEWIGYTFFLILACVGESTRPDDVFVWIVHKYKMKKIQDEIKLVTNECLIQSIIL